MTRWQRDAPGGIVGLDKRPTATQARRLKGAFMHRVIPTAVVWSFFLAWGPHAVRAWALHDPVILFIIWAVVLVAADKLIPWHLGGKRKPVRR